MQYINVLLPIMTFLGAALGNLIARASPTTTEAVPSLVAPDLTKTDDALIPDGDQVSITWNAGSSPPRQLCHPYDIAHRDDNCYPKIADCQHIYNEYYNFSNSFCLDQPSASIDFGTLVTWKSCMIQVSLINDTFSCAGAVDIADKINKTLTSDYKSPDGKGVWTSFGNMKCPDGSTTSPDAWMEWYMGCAA